MGYTGNQQTHTPNIDAKALDGIILDRFYTNPICTPTRGALLTAKNSIRLGKAYVPFQFHRVYSFNYLLVSKDCKLYPSLRENPGVCSTANTTTDFQFWIAVMRLSYRSRRKQACL